MVQRRSKPLFLHGLLLRRISANYAVAAWRDEQTAEEGILPWVGEEHGAAVHPLRVGESVDGQAATVCAEHPRCVLKGGNEEICRPTG